ncbi:unnamed protein product [Aphanomyces euteiches]
MPWRGNERLGLHRTEVEDDGEFDRPGFDVLLKHHRAFDRESMLASGIDQNDDEKLQLLDELLSAVDDSIMQDKERVETAISDSQRDESEGERIRNEALSSLGKRKKIEEENDGNSTGGGRLIKLTTSMQEDNKADLELRKSDLEFRKYQFETELAEREKVVLNTRKVVRSRWSNPVNNMIQSWQS